ncbi:MULTISPECIES: DUF3558 domain-containing protein [unclassified Amycolatopsis]|uniref:DUF3558 domain-containing protein n=1 Tax=unclassified Amycolatopsis TaxID=2618356 RepID=UPI00055E3311|nr:MULTISPECIES: DUF3558 domain-containing protein [unclassified Amycolatopsis]
MRPCKSLAALIAAAAVLSTAACGGSNAGSATPAPSAASSSNTNGDGAPKVEQPITNTSGFETDPCSVIPTASVESAGGKVDRTKVENSSTDKTCAWVFTSGGNFSGSLVTGNTHGLDGVYMQHRSGVITYFKPQPAIQGYPAVVYDRGQPAPGRCNLAVGIRDDLTYTVVTQLMRESPAYADPCALATKLAGAAISHMKGQ